ncbi:MAG: hypothetical protein WDZ82_01270 [Candidatus Paceibacterota bacterium]
MHKYKKSIGALAGILMFAPLGVMAHGGPTVPHDSSASAIMMMHMEEEALGSDRHEEMEVLMEKLFAGELSEEESVQLEKLSRDHSGAFSMMANRMHHHDGQQAMIPGSSMFSSATGWAGVLMALAWLVWIGVGVALLALLLKKIIK